MRARLPLFKRTFAEFRDDDLTDWAAALTYYGLLSLFPALIALVSIIGLVGDPQTTTRKVTEVIAEIGPDSAAETFTGPVESIASNRGTAGVAFVLGLAVAIWSASGYVGAFIRASNVDLRNRRGPALLEAAPAADRDHPGDGPARRRCSPSAWC